MKLSNGEVKLFYKLYHSLWFYVNEKFNIVKGINSAEDFKKFAIKEVYKLRNGLYEHPKEIDSFVAENPLRFSPDELKIIGSWKNFVKGKFLIFRYLKNYTVFLEINKKMPKAYGVLALNSTFEEIIGSYLPIMVGAVLLPFNDKIIYDSLLSLYPIVFGSGVRRSFNDTYQQAKLKFGIITSLPFIKKKAKQGDAEKLKRRSYCKDCW